MQQPELDGWKNADPYNNRLGVGYSHKPNTYVQLVLCIVATIRIKVTASIRITDYRTDMHRKSTW